MRSAFNLMRFALTAVFALAITAAHANYERGMEAMQRGDAAAAFSNFKAAADAGDSRAYGPLAFHYLYGDGTRQDPRAARSWAAKAGATGTADGLFAQYAVLISAPELNFVDAKGNIDRDKYRTLAARPISAREDEMTAYDALGKAAKQDNANARLSLAGFYADNVGEGNRAKAEAILDKIAQKPPVFEGLRKNLAELDVLGPSMLTIRLAGEVVPAAMNAARLAAAEKDKAKTECKDVKPLGAQRLGPIKQAIWLPLADPDMQQAYLMSGTWDERWGFDVCGAVTPVIVVFTADGLGSATFVIEK